MSGNVKECSVLYIHSGQPSSTHAVLLRTLGLRVRELCEWPDDEREVLGYEVVIVRLAQVTEGPAVGMRVRAKRNFGRRVLVAVVDPDARPVERRVALESGFDVVITDAQSGRVLAAQILRVLRNRPEYRCRIPRKSAA